MYIKHINIEIYKKNIYINIQIYKYMILKNNYRNIELYKYINILICEYKGMNI